MRKMKKFSDGGEVPDFSRLTFKEAFAAARGGPGVKKPENKEFTWNGKRYNTNLAVDKAKAKEAPSKSVGPDESAAETGRLIRAAASAAKSEINDKPLEEVHPEMMMIGGPGLKALQRGAKSLAEAGAAKKAAVEVAERVEPRLGVAKPIVRAPERVEPTLGEVSRRAASPRDRVEPTFKKGGSVSSASRRADGCAVRGKTKGKMY